MGVHRTFPGRLAAEFQHARAGRARLRGEHHRVRGEARPHGLNAAPQEALRQVGRPPERRVLGRPFADVRRVPGRAEVFDERGQPEDGGKDVFVHVTAVQAAGLNGLDENQKVTHEVVTERGKQAAASRRRRTSDSPRAAFPSTGWSAPTCPDPDGGPRPW